MKVRPYTKKNIGQKNCFVCVFMQFIGHIFTRNFSFWEKNTNFDFLASTSHILADFWPFLAIFFDFFEKWRYWCSQWLTVLALIVKNLRNNLNKSSSLLKVRCKCPDLSRNRKMWPARGGDYGDFGDFGDFCDFEHFLSILGGTSLR